MGFGILYFFFNQVYDKVWTLLFKPNVPVAIKAEEKPDPIIAFVKQRQDRLLRTYDKTIDMNVNIEPIFYNKQKFSECMREENNPLESRWKKNLLYESTPRGNIFMYYDVYKSGFAYYADQNCIPYSILNAMAMKYVVVYFCRDFFVDESVIKEPSKLADSPIDPVVKKPSNKPSNEHMAKFKNYKTMEKDKDNKNVQQVKSIVRNKFISLGKPYNLPIIQKTSKIPKLDMVGSAPSKYDAIFSKPKLSYKDFKASIASS
jgi:hypothetical protein